MLKYHSLHGHLYYYIGDYRTYLPNSDQLGFIYRGMDRAHDVLLPRLDKNVQDYVHDRTDAKSVGNKAVGVQAPPWALFCKQKQKSDAILYTKLERTDSNSRWCRREYQGLCPLSLPQGDRRYWEALRSPH